MFAVSTMLHYLHDSWQDTSEAGFKRKYCGVGSAPGLSGVGSAPGLSGVGSALGLSGVGSVLGFSGVGSAPCLSGVGPVLGLSGVGSAPGLSGVGSALGHESLSRQVPGIADLTGDASIQERLCCFGTPMTQRVASLSSEPDVGSTLHSVGGVVGLNVAGEFERTMVKIGRTHRGPNSTYGEGECALFATLQSLQPDLAEDLCQHALLHMERIADLRLAVKNVVLDMKCDGGTKERLVEAVVCTTVAAQVSQISRAALWSSAPGWVEVAEKLGKLVTGMLASWKQFSFCMDIFVVTFFMCAFV
jgi:hypothetical protein